MKFILFTLLFFLQTILFGQETKSDTSVSNIVYEYAQITPQPTFDIPKFLSSNLQYPRDAQKKGIQGTVNVKFIVNTDGSLDSIHIVGNRIKNGELLESEAIRVVKKMPKWLPGKMNDETVRVFYTQRISWRIEN